MGRLFADLDRNPVEPSGESLSSAEYLRCRRSVRPDRAIAGDGPADIDLTITGETLTLRGERKRPRGVKDDQLPSSGTARGAMVAHDHAAGSCREHAGRCVVCRRDPDSQRSEGRQCQAAPDRGHGRGCHQLERLHVVYATLEIRKVWHCGSLATMNVDNPTIRVSVGSEPRAIGSRRCRRSRNDSPARRRTRRRSTSTKDPTG